MYTSIKDTAVEQYRNILLFDLTGTVAVRQADVHTIVIEHYGYHRKPKYEAPQGEPRHGVSPSTQGDSAYIQHTHPQENVTYQKYSETLTVHWVGLPRMRGISQPGRTKKYREVSPFHHTHIEHLFSPRGT